MTKAEVDTLKKEVSSLKSLLKWFIVLSISVLGVVVQNSWANAGFRKVIQQQTITMKEAIDHNSKIIEDMATQGIEKGWYKPEHIWRGDN